MADEKIQPDYESMTVEQMAEALARGEGLVQVEVDAFGNPVAKESQDEPPPPEPEKVDEEPPVTEGEEEPPAETNGESHAIEERISALELHLEEERLRREKAEAQFERERFLASRNAGEAGYYRKLASERTAQPRQEPTEEADVLDDEPKRSARRAPDPELEDLRRAVADMRATETERAVRDAIDRFQQSKPDYPEHAKRITQIMEHAAKDDTVIDALASGDAKLARITITTMLAGAYADAKLEAVGKRIAERKASSKPSGAADKRLVTGAAPGASPPTKTKPKATEDLTAAEANAELKRLYGR